MQISSRRPAVSTQAKPAAPKNWKSDVKSTLTDVLEVKQGAPSGTQIKTAAQLPAGMRKEFGKDLGPSSNVSVYRYTVDKKPVYLAQMIDGDQWTFSVHSANGKKIAGGSGYDWSDGSHVSSFRFSAA
jgi:hypothetical protein